MCISKQGHSHIVFNKESKLDRNLEGSNVRLLLGSYSGALPFYQVCSCIMHFLMLLSLLAYITTCLKNSTPPLLKASFVSLLSNFSD